MALLLIATACSGDAEPSPVTDSPSTVVTTAAPPPDDPPATTQPPPTTATCAEPGEAWTTTIDLDGDDVDETILLEPAGDATAVVVVCIGENAPLSIALDAADPVIEGFQDLDEDGVREILYTHARSRDDVSIRTLSAATVTLRGLQATKLAIDRWSDRPGSLDEPFTGESFQCIDWEEDGSPDLVHWFVRPADEQVNIRAAIVTLDGLDPIETGVDSYETDPATAVALLEATHGCAPGDIAVPTVRYNEAGWARVPIDATVFDASDDLALTAAATDGQRIVAVGVENPNPLVGGFGDPSARAWWSDDGVEWNAADVPDPASEILDVVHGPSGFVAVGAIGDNAAAWTSTDGSSWSASEVPAHVPGGQAVMYSVASGPAGLVAVGAEMYFPDIDAAAWTSSDGAEWSRIVSPAFGTPGEQPNDNGEFNAQMLDVAVTVDGLIVAVGTDSDSDPNIDFPDNFPAAWASTDGVAWQRQRLGQDARLFGVAAFGGHVLGFGTSVATGSPTSDAVIVQSSDGLSWDDVSGEFSGVTATDGIQLINDVVAAGDGFVAVGSAQSEADTVGAAAVWNAADVAGPWQRTEQDVAVFGDIEDRPALVMNGAIVVPSGLVLVTGFAAETMELAGGGSACCLIRPQLWLYDPMAAGS